MELTFIVIILCAITSLSQQKVNMSSMGGGDEKCSWLYSPKHDTVYKVKGSECTSYGRAFTDVYSINCSCSLPSEAVPATVAPIGMFMVCLISPAPLFPNYKQNLDDPIAAFSDDPVVAHQLCYPDGQHRCNEFESIDSDDGSESVQEQKQSVNDPSSFGLLTSTDKDDDEAADRGTHREQQRSRRKKTPAASSPVTARPHFPVLNNADVARQENFF